MNYIEIFHIDTSRKDSIIKTIINLSLLRRHTEQITSFIAITTSSTK